MNAKNDDATRWYCPLLDRVIESGYCIDINYQRVGLFKPDVLKDVMKLTELDVTSVSRICRTCPNQPLSRQDYGDLGITEDVP